MTVTLEQTKATDIASKADFENLENYGDNLEHYIENSYTYIPIPDSERYYDREEGVLKDFDPGQYIDADEDIVSVLEKLANFPFLWIENHVGTYFSIDGSGDDFSGFSRVSMSGPGSDDFHPSESDTWDDEQEWLTARELEEEHPLVAEEELDKPAYQIITLADLNRRRSKEQLYPVIAELADTLSKKIENEHQSEKDLYPQLRASTIGNWQKSKQRGLDIHIAEYMTLTEMSQVIQASDDSFVSECGFSSKTQCQKKLGSINELRNKIMHANRTLVHDRDDIETVLDRINQTRDILNNIN
ncbi:hypothetical protein [Natrinema limicola]|uniref:hypothetical protein n=1 Tax=Natrinema limicola TaxID=370323 RepID=UPI0012674443|nr:hypothetical protein [Natrinema limicola]